MERMWGGPTVTTIAGVSRLNAAKLAEASGLAYRPVRQDALQAAEGSTDFAGLFLGLGLFIIVSGLAFASGTLKLLLVHRLREFGILAACGVQPSTVRLCVGAECAILAGLGTFFGTFGGAAYAWAVVRLLNSGWADAVGSTPIYLHLGLAALAAGFGASLAVSLATVWLALRSIGWLSVLKMLRPSTRSGPREIGGRRGRGLIALFALMVATAAAVSWGGQTEHFFISGGLLLMAGLILLAGSLGNASLRNWAGAPRLGHLALRNLAVRRGHAVLVAGVLACASFALIAVAANARLVSSKDLERPASGSGGFALILTTHTGLPFDLNESIGRRRLGLPDDPALEAIDAVPFLMHEGDDASCLNLAKPQSPTLLAAMEPAKLKGRFTVEGKPLSVASKTACWKDLIEAWADSETARWILHTGLGQTYRLGPSGRDVKVAGLVKRSLFAREVLVGKGDFLRMFPGYDAPRYFLIEARQPDRAAKLLREGLAEYGARVERVDRLIAELMGVQNAYIKTFLALGGLGLALGTFGLVSALVRSVAERRSELALLSAIGFSRAMLVKLLVYENVAVMIYGIGIGSLSALFAVAGIASQTLAEARWLVASILASAVFLGAVACAVAAAASVRGSLVAALRSE